MQLIKPFDLRGKTEKRRRAILIPDQDPQLIQDFWCAQAAELLALMCHSNNFCQLIIEKFCQFRYPMADDIVKQLPRQLAHPMVTISEECAGVP